MKNTTQRSSPNISPDNLPSNEISHTALSHAKNAQKTFLKKITSFWYKVFSLRFELLLASLILVFLLNIFFPFNVYGGFAQAIYLPIQLAAGIILFEKKRAVLVGLCMLAIGIVLCHWLDFLRIVQVKKELMLLYIFFFSNVTIELFRQMSHIRAVTTQSVVAAICGLLLIGYCGFYVFLAIETHHPGSFKNIGSGADIINALFYFSYITILTIGYGDIVPHTWGARNAVVFLGVIAYIYSVVVVAAIVGRLRRSPPLTAAPRLLPTPLSHAVSAKKYAVNTELLFVLESIRYAEEDLPSEHEQISELLTHIEALCYAAKKTGISVQYHADSLPPLKVEQTRALHRIVYEALDNIVKHAHARHVYVHLSIEGDVVTLTVEDDGQGFDTGHERQASASGFGLQLMQIYARMAEAEFDISATNGRGTLVTLKIFLAHS